MQTLDMSVYITFYATRQDAFTTAVAHLFYMQLHFWFLTMLLLLQDVTPKHFLSILTGNAQAMQGIGSGKVIASGPNDHVFVYFADHGAPGLIAFPTKMVGLWIEINQLVMTDGSSTLARMVVWPKTFLNVFPLTLNLNHSRTRSNAFGDARFWFCPNLIKLCRILPISSKFYPNLPKKNARVCGRIPSSYATDFNPKAQKPFRETKWRHFSGKCLDTMTDM